MEWQVTHQLQQTTIFHVDQYIGVTDEYLHLISLPPASCVIGESRGS